MMHEENDIARKAFVALTHVTAGADARWKARALTGMNDDDLKKALAFEIGDESGVSDPRTGLRVAGIGAGLRVWVGGRTADNLDRPTFKGAETVRMALSASETGHLVISTMNTPSAAKTIERLIDLFPPGDQPQVRMTLAGGLRLIISQRLLPNADRSGLRAAAELLPGSPPLWALIRDNKTFQIPSLQQRGKALGIIRLDDSLAELVRTGRTTLEIAKDYAEAPDQLEALVKQNTGAKPAEAFGAKTGKLAGLDRK
jgi:hypothetical protein